MTRIGVDDRTKFVHAVLTCVPKLSMFFGVINRVFGFTAELGFSKAVDKNVPAETCAKA